MTRTPEAPDKCAACSARGIKLYTNWPVMLRGFPISVSFQLCEHCARKFDKITDELAGKEVF